ncbi:arylsulfatase B-like isoform X1 [Hydractinia symbiolongicarpus]|uniref:arylsulfatase B-like isoform X1 n=1 Tax=Hydractinia symbiolongicarpus TaxID=13093 RepID=UPI00254FC18F|nr:arylsulfatase B-like isoform X1 [Hydractinia symbiolongicarpus]
MNIFLILCLLLLVDASKQKKPHIIMIVADDLGWNDVSFHGSQQIPTPNIDKLAQSGIILNNYYVLPICTPTRSAIMTGRYPIHTGMHGRTVQSPQPWGVGLKEKFLPQYLKKLGYSTHAVGKWHLGFFAKEYTPTYRGFDSFYGFYSGKADYWYHAVNLTYCGLDLHHNLEPVYTQWGNYSTEIFTAEAEDRIRNHNISEPMFLYLAYQAVHSANRPEDPLQAPQEWIDKFKHIKHRKRRKYAAMVAYMDYGIGRIYNALKAKEILEDLVIVFTSDNGAAVNGFNWNYGNNFPLRGAKSTLWEGGVRAAGFIHSKLLKNPGRVSMDLMHVTDWLPTFVNLAGGSVKPNNPLDGVDQWETLQNMTPSPRKEILLNIDNSTWKNAALRVGDYKLIQQGKIRGNYWDGWYPPPQSHRKTKTVNYKPLAASVQCGKAPVNVTHCTRKHGYCLFNIKEDPCEYHDLSKEYPDIFKQMLARLDEYRMTMVPPRNNKTVDPLSNPKLHNGVWKPWVTL